MRTHELLDLPAPDVARWLLNATLTSRIGGDVVALRVTEVEAYGGVGEDPGSHAHRGQTARNAVMFGPSGRCYVYFTYGMHWCANVVTGPAGTAGGVLLRAGEVTRGIDVARFRRPAARIDRDLARGPARLAAALGIDGALDGADLLKRGSPLHLELPRRKAARVVVSPRTGVSGEGALTPWRFTLPDERTVSPYRPAAPRRSE